MNFFEFLRRVQDQLKVQRRKLECVVVDKMVARGHYFLVEHDEKYYLLVNSHDFDIAFAWLVQSFPMTDIGTLMQNSYNGTPIVEDPDLTKRIVCGIFRLVGG